MFKKAFPAIFALLIVLAGCRGNDFSYPMNLKSTLNDQGNLSVRTTVAFDDQRGLDELKKKEGRIQMAFQLVFRDYTFDQLNKNTGQYKVLELMKKILASQLKSKVRKVKVIDFNLAPRH